MTTMKLQFNPDLPYQKQAIDAVVDLFSGQLPKQSNFTVLPFSAPSQPGLLHTENGIGNRLDLDEETILMNLQGIQLRNGLKQSESLSKSGYDFDIEMETGTGKTYVYLRSIYELNKNYGFTKFVIVVDDDVNTRNWEDVIWAITTRMDPARDTTLIENTPIDYLDFASPVSGLGSKMGLDATNKWPGETSRAWGTPIVMDQDVKNKVDEIWDQLGL